MVSNVPIRIIQTIVFLIADRNPRNAIYVVTRNQLSKTSFGPGFVVIRRLIRTITAIIVSVAIPHCRNASVIVRTSETVARAGSLRAGRIVLVGVVTAIVITVTEPERLDAVVGRIAFDMTGRTSRILGANVAGFVNRVGILAIIYSIGNLVKKKICV